MKKEKHKKNESSRSNYKKSNFSGKDKLHRSSHDDDVSQFDEDDEKFRPSKSLSRSSRLRSGSAAQTSKEDIAKLILADHLPLKRLISVIKDTDVSIRARRRSFEQFVPLLLVHAHAEEESFYAFLKDENKELRLRGLEGEVEHALAEHMIEEVRMAEDAGVWSARAKVLAELVAHHIEEEEEEIIPDFKKDVDVEDRVFIGKHYLDLKDHFRRESSLTNDEMVAIEEERNRDYLPTNLMQ